MNFRIVGEYFKPEQLMNVSIGMTPNGKFWIDKIFDDKQIVSTFDDDDYYKEIINAWGNKSVDKRENNDIIHEKSNTQEEKENGMENELLLKLMMKEVGYKVLLGEPFTVFDITSALRVWMRKELYHSDVTKMWKAHAEEILSFLEECSYVHTSLTCIKGPVTIYHHNADDPEEYLKDINYSIDPNWNSGVTPTVDDEEESEASLKIQELMEEVDTLRGLMMSLIGYSERVIESNFMEVKKNILNLKDQIDICLNHLDVNDDYEDEEDEDMIKFKKKTILKLLKEEDC